MFFARRPIVDCLVEVQLEMVWSRCDLSLALWKTRWLNMFAESD
jgi:hypothetical protein